MLKILKTGLLAAAIYGFASAAPAATLVFSDFRSNDAQQLNPTLTIAETGVGTFDVFLEALPSGESGFVTGLYLGTTGDIACAQLAIGSAGAGSCADDPSSLTNGGLNGLVSDYSVFDFALSYPQQGGPRTNRLESSEFPTLVFSIDTSGAATPTALSDFTSAGLRFQGVTFADGGGQGDGSDKLIDDGPAPIPLPATAWLLIAGLGALRLSRRG